MLDTGIVPVKNPDAFFPTPAPVVDEILRRALLDELPKGRPTLLLEPSAGTGAIAVAALHAAPSSCAIHCVEIHPGRSLYLSGVGLPHVWNEDFLMWGEGVGEYDRILMNPPFARADDATAWLTHVERALSLFLAGTGRLVSVVPSGYQQRADKRHSAFRASIAGRSEYLPLPKDSFKESGTGVNAGLLIVDGIAA
jgi:predicted RNA methylase